MISTYFGRNIIPTAVAILPSIFLTVFGSIESLNRSLGIAVITPAPSPETLSAEEAPLCSIQAHASKACLTTS